MNFKTIAVVMLAGCGPAVLGDGSTATETKELSGAFTRLSIGGAVELTVTTGASTPVVFTGEKNIISQYDVTVADGMLTIKPKELTVLQPTKPVRATVTVPKLEALNASGASTVILDGMSSDTEVAVEASGSSDVTTGLVTAPSVKVNASGSSDVKTSGVATNGAFVVTGASDIIATGLASEVLNVNVSGSSSLKARASKEARGTASGSSNVTVDGAPTVREILSSGSSEVVFN